MVSGKKYDHWEVNDHCHIQDEAGKWHLFGITHPQTSLAHIHDGEFQLFHAVADTPEGPYQDLGTVLPPSERPGERPEFHSPSILYWDGWYYMICGPWDFRLYRSKDLNRWESQGIIFSEPYSSGARDPQIQIYNGQFLLCYCMYNQVYCRTSADLRHWDNPKLLFTLHPGLHPESPFLYFRGNTVYLLFCLWDGVQPMQTADDAYQSITQVFAAPELRRMTRKDFVCTLRAHAPELLEYRNRLFLTSAFYPSSGIHLCELSPWPEQHNF